jgi:hypothetical protein
MRIVHRSARLLIPLLLLAFVPAPHSPATALYKKIKVFVLVPPERILSGVNQIAVLDFSASGRGGWGVGRRFSDYLISQLLEPDRGIHRLQTGFLGMGSGREGESLQEGAITNVFQIVERTRLEEVMQEQSLEASELLDESNAVDFGRLLGVQAIVLGGLTHTQNSKNSTRTNVFTGETEPCLEREVRVHVRFRVVGTETAEIMGSEEARLPVEEKKCGGSIDEVPPMDELLERALAEAAVAAANYVTPHFELREFELERISTREFSEAGEEAAEAAEDLDVDEAYLHYWTIYEQDPYNPRVLYNIGILHEVVGNYRQAQEFYGMAYQLRDEGRYRDAVDRVERNVAFADMLAQIGIVVEEHEFRVTGADLARISATQVEVKGAREQRTPVFARPDEASSVVVQVPGGVTFAVVAQEGDWFRVQLMGGGEGYLHKSKVKVRD